jgi:hypothetical protein
MERQNVTLSIPKSLLKKAKHLAVEEGTSLSALLVRQLEELVQQFDAYQQAAERTRKRLQEGFDLGTGGKRTWTRDELHER